MYRNRHCFVAICCLLAYLFHGGAAATAPGQEPMKFDLQTVWLDDPVGAARQIRLSGEAPGKGEITFDRNAFAGYTPFGDAHVVTDAFFPPVQVDFKGVKMADPAGLGRSLFLIVGCKACGCAAVGPA